MNRSIKNLIMGIVIAVALGLSVLTFFMAKNSLGFGAGTAQTGTENFDSSNIPDQSGNSGEIPTYADGEEPSMADGEQPTFADGEQPSFAGGEQPDGEAPDMDESSDDADDSSGENSDSSEVGDFQGGDRSAAGQGSFGTAGLSVLYYILFAIEGLVLVFFVIYLIMSGGNKKTFKETFGKASRIVVCVVLTVVLAAGITIGESALVKRTAFSAVNNTQMMGGGQPEGESGAADENSTAVEETTESSAV